MVYAYDATFFIAFRARLRRNHRMPRLLKTAHGQSVTDACIGWDATVAVLEQLADAVRQRRAGTRA